VVEQLAYNVGRKIKELRKERRLSLRQVAEMAELAPSTIQKVEGNRISPTLGTLLRIARAFGKDPYFFLDGFGPLPEVAFQRPHGRTRLAVPDRNFSIEPLTPDVRDQLFSAVILIIAPGAKVGHRVFPHQGEELQHCLQGEVEYTVQGKKYRLRPGDTLRFKTQLPHRWANVGKGEARLLMICSPPIQMARSQTQG
jgi:transcriptional regulator with XRE-family HTH domain